MSASSEPIPGRSPAGVLDLLRRILPTGRPLPDAVWNRRHRTILLMLWIHAVGLTVFGIVRGAGVGHSLLEGAAIAVFALGASARLSRRARAVLATLGIFSASSILVHLSGGTIEAHFHFFVMIGVISLYQDWTPFLLAVGYVVVHHGTIGVLSPESVYNHPAAIRDPWMWAGIHGLFILGACAVSLIAWRLNEDSRAKAEEYYRRLYEGERAITGQLREAQQMKDELIAMVSHELRTPLTSIIGFGQTLSNYWDRLSEAERLEAVDASLRQAERLRRHVENLLHAARVSERDVAARADLAQTVRTAVEELEDVPDSDAAAVDLHIADEVTVAMGADALHLIVVNLVGNALKYATPGTVISVAAGAIRRGRTGAYLMVANHAPRIAPEDLERLFEPFVQLDSSSTRARSGMGLGLHIVRRMVDLYEGTVDARWLDGQVLIRVELPSVPAAAPADPPEKPLEAEPQRPTAVHGAP